MIASCRFAGEGAWTLPWFKGVEDLYCAFEPHGFAVYWEDLDDGIEVNHLLALGPLE